MTRIKFLQCSVPYNVALVYYSPHIARGILILNLRKVRSRVGGPAQFKRVSTLGDVSPAGVTFVGAVTILMMLSLPLTRFLIFRDFSASLLCLVYFFASLFCWRLSLEYFFM